MNELDALKIGIALGILAFAIDPRPWYRLKLMIEKYTKKEFGDDFGGKKQ